MPAFTKQWLIVLLAILLPVQTIAAQVRVCPHRIMGAEPLSPALKLPDHACCKDLPADRPAECDYCSWCIFFGSAGTFISADFNIIPFVEHGSPRSESSWLKFQLVAPLLKPPRHT